MSRGKHRKKRRIPAAAAVVVPVAVVLVVSAGDGVRQLPGLAGSNIESVPPELSVPVSASVSVLAVDGSLPADPGLSPEVLAAIADARAVPPGPEGAVDLSQAGIPEVAMRAYARAQQLLAATQPGCKVQWTVLAAIGRIESGHADAGAVDASGRTINPILGPVLDGRRTAAVADTDGGRWDGDSTWDRAVGPMQFIPATWGYYGTDGSGDGTADPNNLYDAAVTAARYLCAGGTDMSDPTEQARAIFRYNHSDSYVRSVLTWVGAYASGVTRPPAIVPAPGTIPPGPGSILASGPGGSLAAAGTTVAPQAGNAPGGSNGGIAVPPLTVPGTGSQVPGVGLPGAQIPGVPVTTPPKPPTTTAPKPPTTTRPPVPTTKPPTTTPKPPTTTKPPATTTPPPTTTRPNMPGTDWYDWTIWVPWR